MINKIQCHLKATSSTDLLSIISWCSILFLSIVTECNPRTEESKCIPFVMSIVFSKLNSFYADVVHELSHIFIRVHYNGKKFSFEKYEAQEEKPYAIM